MTRILQNNVLLMIYIGPGRAEQRQLLQNKLALSISPTRVTEKSLIPVSQLSSFLNLRCQEIKLLHMCFADICISNECSRSNDVAAKLFRINVVPKEM